MDRARANSLFIFPNLLLLLHPQGHQTHINLQTTVDAFRDSEDCMAHFRRKLGVASLEWRLLDDQKYKAHRPSSVLGSRDEK